MTDPGKMVTLPSLMYFVVFSTKTAFFKFDDIFPECSFYRKDSPQIEPLMCLQFDNCCTVGKNCMEVLCRRLYVMFEEVCTQSDLAILYFKKRNFEGLGAGVFWADLERARVITMNPTAWERVKARGNVYQFDPNQDFFLTGSSAPPEEVEETEDQLLD